MLLDYPAPAIPKFCLRQAFLVAAYHESSANLVSLGGRHSLRICSKPSLVRTCGLKVDYRLLLRESTKVLT